MKLTKPISVKATLRYDQPSAKGLAVILQVNTGRTRRISLGIKVKEADWNPDKGLVRKTHPDHERLNKIIKNAIAQQLGQEPEDESLADAIVKHEAKRQQQEEAAQSRGEVFVPSDVVIDAEARKFIDELNTAGRTARRKQEEQRQTENERDRVWMEHLQAKNTPTVQKAPGLLATFDEHILKLKQENAVGTATNYTSTRNKIASFIPADIPLSDIDVKWLKSFDSFMANQGLTSSSKYKHHKSVRKLLHDAVREDLILANPYRKMKLKQDTAEKKFLTEEQLKVLQTIELSHLQHVARQMYLFSLYSGGLRVRDTICLKYRHLKNNGTRLEIRTGKTQSDVAFNLVPDAIAILNEFKKPGAKADDFVFPLLNRAEDKTMDAAKFYKRVSSCAALLNKNLAKVAKKMGIEDHKLNYHSSRHSFATLALNRGGKLEIISKAMGHRRLTQTQHYAKLVDKTVSDELNKLFGT